MKVLVLYIFILLLFFNINNSNALCQECWEAFTEVTTLQKKSQWCWAACLEMVLNFNGIDKDQCEVVSEFYNVPACDYPEYSNFPVKGMKAVKKYLTKTRFNNTVRFKAKIKNGGLSMNQIISEIDACRPIMVEISTSPFNLSTHCILLTGYWYLYYSDVLYLTIVDPYPYDWSSVYSRGTYGTTLSQLTSIWKSTLYGIKKYYMR